MSQVYSQNMEIVYSNEGLHLHVWDLKARLEYRQKGRHELAIKPFIDVILISI